MQQCGGLVGHKSLTSFSDDPFSKQMLMDFKRDMGCFATRRATPSPELSAMAEVFPPWFMATRATAPGRAQDSMAAMRQTLLRAQAAGGSPFRKGEGTKQVRK